MITMENYGTMMKMMKDNPGMMRRMISGMIEAASKNSTTCPLV